MGRWRCSILLRTLLTSTSKYPTPYFCRPLTPLRYLPFPSNPSSRFFRFFPFSALPSPASVYANDFVSGSHDFPHDYIFQPREDDGSEKIPVKAFFLCTSIDLRSMQAEHWSNIVPPSSRSANYIVLRYYDFPSEITGIGSEDNVGCCHYMVVFQYGSAVLFNIVDNEVEAYLKIVRRYASGLLPEMRKDDYAVKQNPVLAEDMQGGTDYIVLKNLDIDGIRIIGRVLGQSIALDYFVSQIDGMVEEFTDINRGMEKTGTFTMDRRKLFQLVGKANSNLADVILKVGLFERSEIAWRDAKYAQIFEYLWEEYEVTQRFGNLDFKLKFVEHNIHFLQEVLQNRRSNLLEWCIIYLIFIENVISIYEIIHEPTAVSL
ncbi:hypothetical protein PVL29_001086 [Vitis rotundifolia]|uniref:DUF155 domain-containing protein n=1 Tax=Vitis rotundifolia TaxID=103349 RepID=A0AA39ANL9_VITRO|nr:hypothetical protein PVL29_001086 [Vitis rotundifolia]